MRTYAFTAYKEADLVDDGRLNRGDAFTLGGPPSVAFEVTDNDRRLSGDRRDAAKDKRGQTASIEQDGEEIGNGGQIYVENVTVLLGASGRIYLLAQIEQEGGREDVDDYYTFLNRCGVPAHDEELTVLRSFNSGGVRYKWLDAGPLATNAAPIASDDAALLYSDEAEIAVDVLANDSDPDGDALTIVDVSGGVGTAEIGPDGAIVYTAAPGFVGVDTVTYTVSDGVAESAATLRIEVGALRPLDPVAVEAVLLGDGDDVVTLTNAREVIDGGRGDDAIVARNGVDTLYGNIGDDHLWGGKADDALFGGTGNDVLNGEEQNDHLDGGLGQDSLTGGKNADIFVVGALDAVDSFEDFTTTQGDAIDVSSLLVGYDPATDAIAAFAAFRDQGADSVLSIDVDGADGAAGFVDAALVKGGAGLDAATLEAQGHLLTLANVGPTANADRVAVDEDAAIEIAPLSNDVDPDGGPLSIVSASVDIGVVEIVRFATLIYTPPADYNGPATITYTIKDDRLGVSTATVAVDVRPTGDKTRANDDKAFTEVDAPVAIDALANDTDIDGRPLKITIDGATNGAATVNGDGEIVFTPDAGFAGEAQIDYTVGDDHGPSDTASIRVYVGVDQPLDAIAPGATSLTERDDAVTLTRHVDIVDGGRGDDVIEALNGADTLYGNIGNDVLRGGKDDDRLFGGADDDVLDGQEQSDVLDGGTGVDSLTGGKSPDIFVIRELDARDTIEDFTFVPGEAINVTDALIGYDPSMDAIAEFVLFETYGGDAIMSIDADGAGDAFGFVEAALIKNVVGLDAQTMLDDGYLVVDTPI